MHAMRQADRENVHACMHAMGRDRRTERKSDRESDREAERQRDREEEVQIQRGGETDTRDLGVAMLFFDVVAAEDLGAEMIDSHAPGSSSIQIKAVAQLSLLAQQHSGALHLPRARERECARLNYDCNAACIVRSMLPLLQPELAGRDCIAAQYSALIEKEGGGAGNTVTR